MIEVIDKEILDELRDVTKKFKNEESMLDPNVLDKHRMLSAERFETVFPEIMARFRRFDLEYKGRFDLDYKKTCNKFHDMVMIAKSNKIMIKRADQKALTDLKEKCDLFETKKREAESKADDLENELIKLKTKIDLAIKMHKGLENIFKDEDTKVEENE